MKTQWYALYTRPKFEKKVEQRLQEAGFESWLPLQTVIRQWSDRKKKIEVPLFNGYIFVRTHSKQLYHAVQTDGVATVVTFNGVPAPIREEQIEMIRKILVGPDAFDVIDRKFTRGEPVKIVEGPLKGNTGKWLDWRGSKRVCLEVEQLNHVFLVEVPAPYIEKVKSCSE